MSTMTLPAPPTTSGIRARDLPELRRDVVRYLGGEHAKLIWKNFADNGMFFGHTPIERVYGRGDELLEDERIRWQMAELYYVTADMTTLAVVAGQSLPSFKLQREDLPSDYGILVFEKPIDTTRLSLGPTAERTSIVACAWGPVPRGQVRDGSAGLWMSWWADQDYTRRLALALGKWTRQELDAIDMLNPLHIGYDDETIWWFGKEDDGQQGLGDSQNALVRSMATVRAAWLLMNQEVASVHRLTVNKAQLRVMKRKKLDPHSVRIVSLRRRHTEGYGDDQGDGRHYTHRWAVRGHWRKQWYPTRNDHVPIWIQPHIKGPEGAPLLTGDVVNVWRR